MAPPITFRVRQASLTIPYSPDTRALLRSALEEARGVAEGAPVPYAIRDAERLLTEAHAEAVKALLKKAGLTPDQVALIGFHGQTILHRPERHWTWQIGDGAALARMTGIDVVNDFRTADVKAGGQGAPLMPLYHAVLARRSGLAMPIALINIGGVAQVTYISGDTCWPMTPAPATRPSTIGCTGIPASQWMRTALLPAPARSMMRPDQNAGQSVLRPCAAQIAGPAGFRQRGGDGAVAGRWRRDPHRFHSGVFSAGAGAFSRTGGDLGGQWRRPAQQIPDGSASHTGECARPGGGRCRLERRFDGSGRFRLSGDAFEKRIVVVPADHHGSPAAHDGRPISSASLIVVARPDCWQTGSPE